MQIHRDYLEAGADIVTTNTFGVDRLKYNEHTKYPLKPVVEAAVKNAREAIALSGKKAYVAQMCIRDRPTGNLDYQNAIEIMKLLKRINRRGTTVVVVTHSQELVDEIGGRVITLDRGRLVSDEVRGGHTDEL